MKKLVLTFPFLFILLTGCEPDQARINHSLELVQSQGYTNVTQRDTPTWGNLCADSDTYEVGFAATSPSGKSVQGSVCSGDSKGYTIRFE